MYHASFDIPKILSFAIHLPFGLFAAKLAYLTIEILVIILFMSYMIVFLQYNDERMKSSRLLLNMN